MDTHLRPLSKAGASTTRRKNLYITQADDRVWENATRLARVQGVSLSSLVVEALADYLRERAQQPAES